MIDLMLQRTREQTARFKLDFAIQSLCARDH